MTVSGERMVTDVGVWRMDVVSMRNAIEDMIRMC